MIKRTKGRILLTLLVITGFAGTINTTAPTKKERRLVISYLKDYKTDLLNGISGLSDNQLNFKPSPEEWSIRNVFYHQALIEKGFWVLLEKVMQEPVKPGSRPVLTYRDDELLKMIADRNETITIPRSFHPVNANWNSFTEAKAAFKTARLRYIKYIKTTTEDLRNRFIEVPGGIIDCYQVLLFMAAYSNRHEQQIKEIIAHPAFPEK